MCTLWNTELPTPLPRACTSFSAVGPGPAKLEGWQSRYTRVCKGSIDHDADRIAANTVGVRQDFGAPPIPLFFNITSNHTARSTRIRKTTKVLFAFRPLPMPTRSRKPSTSMASIAVKTCIWPITPSRFLRSMERPRDHIPKAIGMAVGTMARP